jgi:hypothetical protein
MLGGASRVRIGTLKLGQRTRRIRAALARARARADASSPPLPSFMSLVQSGEDAAGSGGCGRHPQRPRDCESGWSPAQPSFFNGRFAGTSAALRPRAPRRCFQWCSESIWKARGAAGRRKWGAARGRQESGARRRAEMLRTPRLGCISHFCGALRTRFPFHRIVHFTSHPFARWHPPRRPPRRARSSSARRRRRRTPVTSRRRRSSTTRRASPPQRRKCTAASARTRSSPRSSAASTVRRARARGGRPQRSCEGRPLHPSRWQRVERSYTHVSPTR